MDIMNLDSRGVVEKTRTENGLVTRRIAGETILVPVSNNIGDLDSIYTLDEVASRIWQLIDGPTPVERIVHAIGNEYDVAADELTRDVVEFLHSLEAEGLVRATAQHEACVR